METKQAKAKVVVAVLALAVLALLSLSGRAGNPQPNEPPGQRIPVGLVTTLDGRVGIGTISPTEKLSIAGPGSAIELGVGVDGKQVDAGKIAYQRWSDGLDIIGAGDTGSRKIRFWAEGGSFFEGNVGIGTTEPKSNLHVTGLLEYEDNAAAKAAGLTPGALYRTGDFLKVVH